MGFGHCPAAKGAVSLETTLPGEQERGWGGQTGSSLPWGGSQSLPVWGAVEPRAVLGGAPVVPAETRPCEHQGPWLQLQFQEILLP